jgi:hypothetical protein
MSCDAQWIELIRDMGQGAGALLAFVIFIWFFRTMLGR